MSEDYKDKYDALWDRFKEAAKPVEIELVQEFYEFLQGNGIPEGFRLPGKRPNLTAEHASTIIYILQEHLHIIPDHYKSCDWCGRYYDSNCEGSSVNEGDEYDEWYRNNMVCPGVIKRLVDTRYCDSGCEGEAINAEYSEHRKAFLEKPKKRAAK